MYNHKIIYDVKKSTSYQPIDTDDTIYKLKPIKFININDVDVIKYISEGSYGKTYIVSYNKEKFILKKTKYSNTDNEYTINTTLKEIAFLRCLYSPYIVNIKYVVLDKYERPHIGLQLLEGDILNLTFNSSNIRDFLVQMLNGLQTLQYNGIIHTDLKPANILYKKNHYYIADFGLSEYISNRYNELKEEPNGTPQFLPIFHKIPFNYDRNIDVFSLAITTIQLLTSFSFITNDYPGYINKYKNTIKKILGYEGYDLIVNKMLGYENIVNGKHKTISAYEALQHPYLKNYNLENILNKPRSPEYKIDMSYIPVVDVWTKKYYNTHIDLKKNITKYVWDILIDWILDTALNYNLSLSTICMTMILICAGHNSNFHKTQRTYQLGGIYSLSIASLFMEDYSKQIDYKDIIDLTANAYSMDEVESNFPLFIKEISYNIPIIPYFFYIEKNSQESNQSKKIYMTYMICKYESHDFSIRENSEYITKQFSDINKANDVAKFIYKSNKDINVIKTCLQKFR